MALTVRLRASGGAETLRTLPDPVVTAPPVGTLWTGNGGNGDFSIGKFGQWSAVHNRYENHTGPHYDTNFGPNYPYPASIVQDGGIPTARFEVRQGDPGIVGVGGSPRSEVADFRSGHMTPGETTWQRFQVKFDPSWPNVHSGSLWSVIAQWHSDTDGSPPLGLGCVTTGKWQLGCVRYAGPGSELSRPKLWEADIVRGVWQDLKFQICWSTSDTQGFVRMWRNGVRQAFVPAGGQSDPYTYYVRTLMPGGGNNYFKQGIYAGPRAEPLVVFHRGYRFGSSEAVMG